MRAAQRATRRRLPPLTLAELGGLRGALEGAFFVRLGEAGPGDRDVKIRLQRLIGLLTPAITVILGVTVAAIIGSIMTAILGFNDLAVAS